MQFISYDDADDYFIRIKNIQKIEDNHHIIISWNRLPLKMVYQNEAYLYVFARYFEK